LQEPLTEEKSMSFLTLGRELVLPFRRAFLDVAGVTRLAGKDALAAAASRASLSRVTAFRSKR